jgi:hypothetical protein
MESTCSERKAMHSLSSHDWQSSHSRAEERDRKQTKKIRKTAPFMPAIKKGYFIFILKK